MEEDGGKNENICRLDDLNEIWLTFWYEKGAFFRNNGCLKFKIWFNGQDQNMNLDSNGFLEVQNLKNNDQVQILNFKNIS